MKPGNMPSKLITGVFFDSKKSAKEQAQKSHNFQKKNNKKIKKS